MRTLYLDCFSGISGDMAVGALRDLGVEESVFHEALAALGLGGEFHAHFHRGHKQNIAGWKFDVHAHEHASPSAHHHSHEHGHEHSHDHPHGEHAHGRSYREIRQLIEASALSNFVQTRALSLFHRIAVAEGKIHGVPAEDVTFHEVGAVDSIADIIATCAGLEALDLDRICASRLVEGSGWIDCAHGRFPLPAPATLEILAGIPLRQIEEAVEFITPTGAAILAEFSESYGPIPEMTILRTGYGLGTRDTPNRPNVLRAILGEALSAAAADTDEITQIETNIDDLSPELAGAAMERLFEAGALDVFFTPAHMKKNRPGFLLTVLSTHDKAESLAKILLKETSAFGVRLQRLQRLKLRREIHEVETPYGLVRMKLGFLGDELVQAAPEYESCREAARRSGVSVRDVQVAAWIAVPPRPEKSA